MKFKGIAQIWIVLIVGLVGIATIGGIMMYGFGQIAGQIVGQAPAFEAGKPEAPSGGWAGVCGTDLEGILYYGYRNFENLTTTEYVATTTEIYKIDPETKKETWKTQGSTTSASATSGNWTNDCGTLYRIYFIASDGVSTSGVLDMQITGNKITEDINGEESVFKGAVQAGLMFKLRDQDEETYTYASLDATVGEWAPSGSTFYSTTSNSTGKTIAAGGFASGKIKFQTNGTASTVTRFTDQSLLVALDVNQTGTDWLEPETPALSNGVATKVTCPDKIGSDGYDFCWEVTTIDVLGKVIPAHVKDSPVTLDFTIYPVSGVNPDDDLKWGFFTSGYVRKTTSNDMYGIAYNKDDTSRSYVYTGQTLTWSIE